MVGVAAAGFAGTNIGFGPDLWIPLTQGPLVEGNRQMLDTAGGWLGMLGILDTPDSLEPARASLQGHWLQSGSSGDIALRRIPRGVGLAGSLPAITRTSRCWAASSC